MINWKEISWAEPDHPIWNHWCKIRPKSYNISNLGIHWARFKRLFHQELLRSLKDSPEIVNKVCTFINKEN